VNPPGIVWAIWTGCAWAGGGEVMMPALPAVKTAAAKGNTSRRKNDFFIFT
jgi:hypothetical protein